MTKYEAKQRIDKLKVQLREIDYAYYVLDDPIVSDAVRDSLKVELEQLEQQFKDLITSDSPTQRIGGKALGKFKKVKHQVAKYSLEDVFHWEDVVNFDIRIKKILNLELEKNIEYTAELKIDGLNISCIYQQGLFKQAITRGDGVIGEDVTHTVKTIKSIPLQLKRPLDIEVGGEIFLPIQSFKKLNQQARRMNTSEFANPRNAAAGTIRQLDPQVAASRDLHAFFYSISPRFISQSSLSTQFELLKFLQSLGLPVEPHFIKLKNIYGVKEYFKKISSERDKLKFDIDGVVVKVNSLSSQNILGRTAKTVRWATAYKFAAKQATTKVKDIIIQVGRTGVLTPVAILKPVKVDGSTVSRATLHNQDEIDKLGVKIGDTVIIQKAGDIIPDIIKVLIKLRTGKEKIFSFPTFCPACGFSIKRKAGEAAYRCINPDCFAVSKEKIYHFVSRKAFNIDGLGPKIIDQLLEQGIIKNAADIFALAKEDLEPLARFADKSIDNLIQSIHESKKIDIYRFIYALGILSVGEQTAIDLVNDISKTINLSINNFIYQFQKLTQARLSQIKDIGPIVARNIYNYFHDEKNIQLIKNLFNFGVKLTMPQQDTGNNKLLANKTFVFTGVLESMSRDEAKQKIRSLGAHVANSVSANTDFVVATSSSGLKYVTAKKLNVQIIDESKFLKMISILKK